jgi:hypothetical protein
MQEYSVAVADAMRGQRGGCCLNPIAERRPTPGRIPPDDRRTIRKPPSGLDQQMREVAGRDQRNGSRIDT